jgi:outer membrane immunogenic protein
MRNKFILAAAASAFAISAVPAMAQDTDAPYSGGYIGGTFGYDVQKNDINERILFDRNLNGQFNEPVRTATGADAFSPGFCNGRYRGATQVRGCTNDRDNIQYSVRAGFDQQFGNLVVGALVEASKTHIKDYVTAFSTTPASYTFQREVDYMGAFRARAGYAAQDTLFYGSFGPTWAKLDNSFYTSNGVNSFTGRDDDDTFGFQAGGGVETRLGSNITIGLEYLYNRLNDDNYRVRVGAGSAPATNPFVLAPNTTGTDLARSESRFTWHSLRVTAGYRF